MKKIYTITEKEFLKAQKLHIKRIQNNYLIFFISGAIVYLAIPVFNFQSIQTLMNNLIESIIFITIFTILFKLLLKYSATKQYLSSRIFTAEMTSEYSDSGITISHETGESILSWETFIQWKEDNDFFLLYPSNSTFIIVPKRIMNAEELDIFKNYLKKYIIIN